MMQAAIEDFLGRKSVQGVPILEHLATITRPFLDELQLKSSDVKSFAEATPNATCHPLEFQLQRTITYS